MPAARLLGPAALAAALLAGCSSSTAAPPHSATAQTATTTSPTALTSPSSRAAPFAAWIHVTAPAPAGTLELLASDGRVLRSLPGGELTAGGTRLLTAEAATATTRLRLLDTASGATLEERALPAGFHLPALGPSQRPVAVAPGDRFAALEDTPPGAEAGTVATTHLAVVDLAAGGATRLMTLQGDFEVDALSSDGTQLYLIESLPPDASGKVDYRVRRVDVFTGALDPRVVVDKSDGEAAMTGLPLSRAFGSDPGWVLTVYGFGAHGPFVHALGVDVGIAFCVDLPSDTRVRDDSQQLLWSLVRDPGGAHAVAVNGGTGQVVELNLAGGGPPQVARTVDIPIAGSASAEGGIVTSAGAKRIVSTGAVLSPDGHLMYAVADSGIVVLDMATLHVTAVLAAGVRPSGIAISPDGSTLLAVEEDGATVDVVDVHTGAATVIAHQGEHAMDAVLAAVAVR
jgi:hypothetical protein